MSSLAKMCSLTDTLSRPAIAILNLFEEYTGPVQGGLLELQESPHHIVEIMDDVRLIHYYQENQSATQYDTPLLIVYAPVSRHHIMDIKKRRSIVEHFVSAGFDVYLLEWGRQPKNEPSLSGYTRYIQRSIDKIKKISHAKQVSILSYSWGGVLSMIYSSLQSANVKNLILQSAHVDFHADTSILASWFRKLPIYEITNDFDLINCRFINLALLMRNLFVHFLDAARFAFDMNKGMPAVETELDTMRIVAWRNDTPLITAGFFREYISKLYQENLLIKKKLEITLSTDNYKPETVDLAKISMPSLNTIREFDDICMPAAVVPINDIATSDDKSLLRFPTGHIELSIGAAAHEKLWPQVVKWLEKRS
jgi:poly[(R)-3-hydroxyalkanoate] polymerase subunit PhaC